MRRALRRWPGEGPSAPVKRPSVVRDAAGRFDVGSNSFLRPALRPSCVRRSRIPVRGAAEVARALAFVFDPSHRPRVRLCGYVRPGETDVVRVPFE